MSKREVDPTAMNTYNIRIINMRKKLTITIDEKVYEGLHKVIGPRRISQFIEDLVKPHVSSKQLDSAYAEMAKDKSRERKALEWSESFTAELDDASR